MAASPLLPQSTAARVPGVLTCPSRRGVAELSRVRIRGRAACSSTPSPGAHTQPSPRASRGRAARMRRPSARSAASFTLWSFAILAAVCRPNSIFSRTAARRCPDSFKRRPRLRSPTPATAGPAPTRSRRSWAGLATLASVLAVLVLAALVVVSKLHGHNSSSSAAGRDSEERRLLVEPGPAPPQPGAAATDGEGVQGLVGRPDHPPPGHGPEAGTPRAARARLSRLPGGRHRPPLQHRRHLRLCHLCKRLREAPSLVRCTKAKLTNLLPCQG